MYVRRATATSSGLPRLRFAFALFVLGGGSLMLLAQQQQPLTRVAATSLTLPADAPSFGFTTQRTLNNLGFNQPVAIVSPPGETNRLFVLEKPGRIMVVPDLANPTSSVFLDLTSIVGDSSSEQGLLALAFHPDYATNGYFYVWYTLNTTSGAGSGRHDRLSRFRVSANNPSVADPTSEQPLITQRDEADNHNGGQLAFGPDGYLYLSLGDEGAGNDAFQNSQRIDKDFFSGMIRIDVDQRPGSLAPNAHPAVHAGTYRVPPDNPFVGATSFNGVPVNPAAVHTEFWAVGLRNPWRWSFDPVTGQLWVGDVGQNAREEVDIITKGGNYGWNYREGLIAGPRANPPPAAQLINPVFDYDRSLGSTITGGIVYRGSALAQLYGAYLFADYGSGRIWSLRYDGSGPAQVTQLTNNVGIVSFGINPRNGDILLANINEGSIRRLVYNATPTGAPFPATLSATGAFTSLATLEPAPGVVAYAPNVSFWSDFARKRRWFALRDTTSTYGFAASGNWTLPAGAVWVKHFDLETTRGDPTTARRVETRFLVKTAGGVYGITYRWNDAQTEATLVAEEGADADFTVVESGVARTQTWHFPSRAECLACHTPRAGYALSFNTRQLNRDNAFAGGTANQITALAQAGYLSGSPPAPSTLHALAAADDVSQSVEWRARSYLDANCSQCHQPGGTALGTWDARSSTPLSLAGIVNGALVNDGGDAANRVIVPGDVAHSRLLHRMAASNGATRMPPLATRERDSADEALIQQWIASLAVPQPASRMVNLSARTFTGTGANVLIPAFVIDGSAPKRVLVRAVGPTLASFNVSGVIANPVLTLFSKQTAIATNTRWNSAPNATEIRETSALLGAFTLPEGSADSALLLTLAPGAYTALASGVAGTTGVALVEVYDADPSPTTAASRFGNTSVRAFVDSNADVLIPGLVVSAGATKRVLIRAVGPGLERFGVTNFLPRPVLSLFAGSEAFLTNAGWSTANNAAEIRSTGTSVFAFELADGSADSAILADLSPGAYTLHISSADGASGVALAEVYEVP